MWDKINKKMDKGLADEGYWQNLKNKKQQVGGFKTYKLAVTTYKLAVTKKYILEKEACGVCGSNLELQTNVEQKHLSEIFAFDGDEATCIECGEIHVVTVVEGEGAYITTL